MYDQLRQRGKEFNIGDRRNCATARGTIALGVPNPECLDMTGAFLDDVAKTNLSAILQRHGPENVRSL